ncbi:MAG: nitrite/sulfite reductase [Phycisphaera sp.]|nr:nitrite/sulfite reductase [Phycisphaera sp.]
MAKGTAQEVEELKQAKDGFDVLADLMRYSEQGDYDAIDAGDLAQRFKWFGVYRQKPNIGHFMLRIKIPGGQLTPRQLAGISDICDQYARGIADITTRQTIQLHWLTIKDIKPIFEKLAALGMNSQFACGDAPRNVVSCPLAGVSTQEIIDSSQAVRDVALMYEKGGKEFSNLPRKFKTSVGGCHLHCHQPQINDVGIFGVPRNEQTGRPAGYGLLVGGGLSSTPHFAQPMRVFLKPEQVTEVCRAIAILFRDHGYREKRTRARLKFLVADKGWQWTRDMIEQILGYKLEHDDTIQHPTAVHNDHVGTGKQNDGNFYVGVPIERGRWTARNMADIARLADKHATGDKRIRLTNKQNVLILDVPEAHVEALSHQLTSVGLTPGAHSLRTNLISCTGSEFCNLAVVETKHRAGAVLRYLEEHTELDRPVFISFTGCPNACAQYQVADIGLTGIPTHDPDGTLDENGKPMKVDGYNVLLGAGFGTDPKFGEVIAKKIPASRVHLAIKGLIDAYMASRIDEDEPFQTWVSRNEPEALQKLITDAALAEDAASLVA